MSSMTDICNCKHERAHHVDSHGKCRAEFVRDNGTYVFCMCGSFAQLGTPLMPAPTPKPVLQEPVELPFGGVMRGLAIPVAPPQTPTFADPTKYENIQDAERLVRAYFQGAGRATVDSFETYCLNRNWNVLEKRIKRDGHWTEVKLQSPSGRIFWTRIPG